MTDETPNTLKTQRSGAWAPFRSLAFTVLWIATVISSVGTWMHDVGAGWLMTELSPSPLVIAAVQAATTLPIFLFALLAGAVADIVNRRKLLIAVNLFMSAVAATLAVFVELNLMTPLALIVFTFFLGTGAAFVAPAWQAIVPSLVAKPELPSAIALNSMGINISRAIGPALAGFLIVSIGLSAPFFLNAVSFLVIITALIWWKPEFHSKGALPSETIGPAILAGLRYAANSVALRNTLIRAAAFFAFASAYWAMLPLIARQVLNGGPTLYGILLASVGLGAVVGALILPYVRDRMSANSIVALGTLGTASVLVVFAVVPNPLAAAAASVLAGMSWIAVLSTMNVSAQTALPEWVRARGLSIFLTVFFGAMSFGSLVWGQVANTWNIQTALIVAAIGAVVFIPLSWKAKLALAKGLDHSPSMHWPEPILTQHAEPDNGPVMIQITYEIIEGQQAKFWGLMLNLKAARARNGGYAWSLMQSSEDRSQYIETWYEVSWLNHLRHHERVTKAEEGLQREIQALLVSNEMPKAKHYVAAS